LVTNVKNKQSLCSKNKLIKERKHSQLQGIADICRTSQRQKQAKAEYTVSLPFGWGHKGKI